MARAGAAGPGALRRSLYARPAWTAFAAALPPAFVLILILVAAPGAADPAPGNAAAQPASARIDPEIAAAVERGEPVEALIVLADQADLSAARLVRGMRARGRWVVERLRAAAARSQPPVVAELDRRGIEHHAYWIVNAVWARLDRPAVEALAARADVARLVADREMTLPPFDPVVEPPGAAPAVAGVEPGIAHVGAPAFWNAGFHGEGVVVAIADTGVDWDHPALESKYRGWTGFAAVHSRNWWDAVHSGGGSCGPDSPEPCDDSGHGTHVTGIMVGDDGAGNQVGMAPGARWIGCRNMDQGSGTVARYTECFQFFIAPTDAAGNDPDPDLAPDAINNSWYCAVSEGCVTPDLLRTVVENTRAAGIAVVAAAGNAGSGCESVFGPPAIYDATFTVGAVNVSDGIASFSSRGPVTVDGSGRLKPDVVAPGVSVRSAHLGGGYSLNNGTSMASPHVTGLAALVLSAAPCLAGDVAALEARIVGAAVPLATAQQCGGFDGSEVPNPVYGNGSVRADPAAAQAACAPLFADGFESGDLGAWSAAVP
jgi:subtilisin family serine protease